MARRLAYDSSAERREMPLRPEEVDALILNGAAVLKDPADILHLLHRVAATLREHHNRVMRLQADVDRIRSEKADARRPLVRAMEALDQLTAEEQRQLLDARFMAEVAKLQAARDQTELEQAAARNDVNRARMVLAELLNDETLDPAVRHRIRAAEMRLHVR